MTGHLPSDLAVLACLCVAPGVALAWTWTGSRDPLVLGGVGLTLGGFVLPVLYFGLAMALRTRLSPALCLGAAAAVVAGCVAWHGVERRRALRRPPASRQP